MLQTFFRKAIQLFIVQRAASRPLCLKTRPTNTAEGIEKQPFPSIVSFGCCSRTKAPLKGRLLVRKPLFYRRFRVTRAVARIFPLHLPVVRERRRFWGGVSALEGHLPVLEGLRGALASRAFWLFWSARWPLWGGPSLSAGLRRKASLCQ